MKSDNKDIWTVHTTVVLIFLALSRFSLGALEGLVGPSLPDLTHAFNETTADYTGALSSRGYAVFFGIFLTTIVIDYAYKYIDLIFAASMLSFGVTIFLIPWFGSPVGVGIIYGVQAIFLTKINLYSVVRIVRMFGSTAAPVLSSVGFLYTGGKILAPVIAEPFITDVNPLSMKTLQNSNHTVSLTRDRSQNIEWNKYYKVPFMLLAGICAGVAVGFVILYFLEPSSAASTTERNTSNHLPPVVKWTAVVLFSGTILNNSALIVTFGYYLYVISVNGRLHFPKGEAVLFYSVVEIACLVSRALTAVILKFVSLKVLYHVYCSLTLLFSIALSIWGLESHWTLWMLAPVTLAALDPLYILGYSYADMFVYVNGTVSAVIECGMALGYILSGWFMAQVYASYREEGILVSCSVMIALFNLCGLFLLLIRLRYGDRYEVKEPEKEDRHPLFSEEFK